MDKQLSPCHAKPLTEYGQATAAELAAGMIGGQGKGWMRCSYERCHAVLAPSDDGWEVIVPMADDMARDEERNAWLADSQRRPKPGNVTETWENADMRGVAVEEMDDGLSYSFGGIPPVEHSRIPDEIVEGDIIRVYGSFGSEVAGVDLLVDDEWKNIYFNTEAERHQAWAADCAQMRAERRAAFEGAREKLDADYASLPEPFQKRIDGYRERGGQHWREEFEQYEMFCCVEAVKIAEYLRPRYEILRANEDVAMSAASKVFEDKSEDELLDAYHQDRDHFCGRIAAGEFYDAGHEEQSGVIDDGHSGNTFGMSLKLAGYYVSGWDEAVIGTYGALAPLVGSEQYGDAAAV